MNWSIIIKNGCKLIFTIVRWSNLMPSTWTLNTRLNREIVVCMKIIIGMNACVFYLKKKFFRYWKRTSYGHNWYNCWVLQYLDQQQGGHINIIYIAMSHPSITGTAANDHPNSRTCSCQWSASGWSSIPHYYSNLSLVIDFQYNTYGGDLGMTVQRALSIVNGMDAVSVTS